MNQRENIIRIDIETESSDGFCTHTDIKLFFCLNGNISIQCQDMVSTLEKDGIMIVNAGEKHSYHMMKDGMAAVFYISSGYISYLTSEPVLRFHCDSSRPPKYDYGQLRDLLKKILTVHYYQRWQERLHEQQYYNMVIAILLRNYALWRTTEDNSNQEQERIQLIVQYIQSSYHKQIGLQNLAEKLHLSVPYLSKYIKQNLGCGFVEYLNNIRLLHAVDDLKTTAHSMTEIAYDNGFPNLNSFNRVFKETFQETPSSFRKKQAENESIKEKRPESQELKLLQGYLSENQFSMQDMESISRIQCRIDTGKYREYRKNWNKVWNLGSIEELLRADVQKHFLLMKRELQFRYVRIWGIFSGELLNCVKEQTAYNFLKMDSVFDFFVENQIRLFLDLGFHPKELYKRNHVILYQENKRGYEDPAIYKEAVCQLLEHYIKRYGKNVVETWAFEVSKDDRLFLHGGIEFFKLFEMISKCIKEKLPNSQVGGGAINVYDDLEVLQGFVQGWSKRKLQPDFISIWVYPYDLIQDGETNKLMDISNDPEYVIKKIVRANVLLGEYSMENTKLYVTRWDLSMSCRNYLNDSCYRSAFLVKNTLSCTDKSEIMACFGSTDLLCEYTDSTLPLYGGYGLITKNAIKKPAFYVYTFLNKLLPYQMAFGENYFATCDGDGNYTLLLYQYCRMNQGYYCAQDQDVALEQVEDLFEHTTLELQIQLQNVKKGNYQIKKYRLNYKHGGILSEWKKLGYKQYLEPDEVKYLQAVTIPQMQYEYVKVKEDDMKLSFQLAVNEVQLIEIKYEKE